MNNIVISFVSQTVEQNDVKDKEILEVGSLNVNGSVRKGFLSLGAKSYHGIDIVPGDDVDEVISIKDYYNKVNKKFDYIICCDMIEHCKNWWEFFEAIPKLLKDGGRILFTTVGIGYLIHLYSGDFWRFSIDDNQTLFRVITDCEKGLETDSIVQTAGGKEQLVNVRFNKESYNKGKEWYNFMLKNRGIFNILVGKTVSQKEWLELNKEGM